ncbi:MAG: hypothetical protein GXY34_13415 [Syntrophomonadaceae bacterium]|nr:hypothetical protein [Syntrophomonadaceae bacterium]
MGYDPEEYTGPVITQWSEYQDCWFAEKAWVNHSDVNTSKTYEKGDFLRVRCLHDDGWCSAEAGPDFCAIFQKHKNE